MASNNGSKRQESLSPPEKRFLRGLQDRLFLEPQLVLQPDEARTLIKIAAEAHRAHKTVPRIAVQYILASIARCYFDVPTGGKLSRDAISRALGLTRQGRGRPTGSKLQDVTPELRDEVPMLVADERNTMKSEDEKQSQQGRRGLKSKPSKGKSEATERVADRLGLSSRSLRTR